MKKRATPNTETKATKSNTVTPSDIQWGLHRAVQTGLRIVEPKPNELQLDIDSVGLLIFHEMQYSILEKAGITKGWKKKVTKSKRGGNHLHVTITAPNYFGSGIYADSPHDNKIINLLMRLLFQSLLGSDLKREAFNTCRVLKGNKYPIVFFEKELHEKNRRNQKP